MPEQRKGNSHEAQRRRAVLSELARRQTTVPLSRNPTASSSRGITTPPRRAATDDRPRRLILVGVVALGLIALVAVLAGRSLFAALPGANAPAGSLPFYLDADVPWGAITLDGAPAHSSAIGRDAPLMISPGKHQLAWNADPFQPQRCAFSVPPATGDTCQSAAASDVGVAATAAGRSVRVLFLRESLQTLAAAERRALTAALQAASGGQTFSAPIFAGERYPTGETSGVISAAQGTATLNLRLVFRAENEANAATIQCEMELKDLVAGRCDLGERNCLLLCAIPWQFRQPEAAATGAPQWLAVAVARLSWTFTDQGGKLLAKEQPLSYGAAGRAAHPILFGISWESGSWHAKPLVGRDLYTVLSTAGAIAGDPACVAAYDSLLGPGEQAEQSFQMRFVSGPSPAAGCLVILSQLDTQGTPLPGGANAHYLYRFTQILAANDVARRLSPQMASATPAQEAVATQLATLPAQMIIGG